MLRTVLASAVLLFALVAAVKPSLTIPEDTYRNGATIPVEWTGSGVLLADMACTDDEGLALRYIAILSRDPNLRTGVTPSWDGTTPLACEVRLAELVNGKLRYLRASDSFELVP